RAIIAMGSCLGMSITAEGVETAGQFDFSVAEGCGTIQGYHISRPLTADAFASFVGRHDLQPFALANCGQSVSF
ncbi:MAG: EAL domain-containing protein, partial [Janthinobacterium lividum]